MAGKRGISPLIATVLIIGFTVALGAVIFLWGSDFIKGLLGSAEEAQERATSCAAATFKLDDVEQTAEDKLKLTVDNTGQENIKSVIVRITGDKGITSVTEPGLVSGDKKAYDVTFDPVQVGVVTSIEVIPTLDINKKSTPCAPGTQMSVKVSED